MNTFIERGPIEANTAELAIKFPAFNGTHRALSDYHADVCLLDCNAAWICKLIPTFWRNILLPSSGRHGYLETLVSAYKSSWRCKLKDQHRCFHRRENLDFYFQSLPCLQESATKLYLEPDKSVASYSVFLKIYLNIILPSTPRSPKSLIFRSSQCYVYKRKSSGTHEVTQNSVGEGGVLVMRMPGKKKVPERRSWLHPSEEELPERRSGAFRHKIPLGLPTKILYIFFISPDA
jgi:hypothetical protein